MSKKNEDEGVLKGIIDQKGEGFLIKWNDPLDKSKSYELSFDSVKEFPALPDKKNMYGGNKDEHFKAAIQIFKRHVEGLQSSYSKELSKLPQTDLSKVDEASDNFIGANDALTFLKKMAEIKGLKAVSKRVAGVLVRVKKRKADPEEITNEIISCNSDLNEASTQDDVISAVNSGNEQDLNAVEGNAQMLNKEVITKSREKGGAKWKPSLAALKKFMVNIKDVKSKLNEAPHKARGLEALSKKIKALIVRVKQGKAGNKETRDEIVECTGDLDDATMQKLQDLGGYLDLNELHRDKDQLAQWDKEMFDDIYGVRDNAEILNNEVSKKSREKGGAKWKPSLSALKKFRGNISTAINNIKSNLEARQENKVEALQESNLEGGQKNKEKVSKVKSKRRSKNINKNVEEKTKATNKAEEIRDVTVTLNRDKTVDIRYEQGAKTHLIYDVVKKTQESYDADIATKILDGEIATLMTDIKNRNNPTIEYVKEHGKKYQIRDALLNKDDKNKIKAYENAKEYVVGTKKHVAQDTANEVQGTNPLQEQLHEDLEKHFAGLKEDDVNALDDNEVNKDEQVADKIEVLSSDENKENERAVEEEKKEVKEATIKEIVEGEESKINKITLKGDGDESFLEVKWYNDDGVELTQNFDPDPVIDTGAIPEGASESEIREAIIKRGSNIREAITIINEAANDPKSVEIESIETLEVIKVCAEHLKPWYESNKKFHEKWEENEVAETKTEKEILEVMTEGVKVESEENNVNKITVKEIDGLLHLEVQWSNDGKDYTQSFEPDPVRNTDNTNLDEGQDKHIEKAISIINEVSAEEQAGVEMHGEKMKPEFFEKYAEHLKGWSKWEKENKEQYNADEQLGEGQQASKQGARAVERSQVAFKFIDDLTRNKTKYKKEPEQAAETDTYVAQDKIEAAYDKRNIVKTDRGYIINWEGDGRTFSLVYTVKNSKLSFPVDEDSLYQASEKQHLAKAIEIFKDYVYKPIGELTDEELLNHLSETEFNNADKDALKFLENYNIQSSNDMVETKERGFKALLGQMNKLKDRISPSEDKPNLSEMRESLIDDLGLGDPVSGSQNKEVADAESVIKTVQVLDEELNNQMESLINELSLDDSAVGNQNKVVVEDGSELQNQKADVVSVKNIDDEFKENDFNKDLQEACKDLEKVNDGAKSVAVIVKEKGKEEGGEKWNPVAKSLKKFMKNISTSIKKIEAKLIEIRQTIPGQDLQAQLKKHILALSKASTAKNIVRIKGKIDKLISHATDKAELNDVIRHFKNHANTAQNALDSNTPNEFGGGFSTSQCEQFVKTSGDVIEKIEVQVGKLKAQEVQGGPTWDKNAAAGPLQKAIKKDDKLQRADATVNPEEDSEIKLD